MMSTQALKAAATGRTELATMKPKDQIAFLLKQKQGEIAKMLPKHLNAERLLKVAQIAATTTPGLIECDVASLVGAIGQCAQMGLEPNTVLGHAYLVPFNTKRKDATGRERWVKSVQVIIGYKGLIDLARRSGQIISIAAHEVCENDHFELVYGLNERLEHKPALTDRGAVIGYYAVAKLVGGGHAFEFMSQTQIDQIKVATQSKGAYGPWKDHPIEMGRKTVIRRLAKYLPLSIEFQTAVALDALAEAGKDQNLETIDGDFLVVPDEDALALEQQPAEPVPGATEIPEPVEAVAAPTEKPIEAPSEPAWKYGDIQHALQTAKTRDELDEAASFISGLPNKIHREQLNALYEQRVADVH